MRLLPLALLCFSLTLPACREKEESLDSLKKRSDALIQQQMQALEAACQATPGQHLVEIPLELDHPERGSELYCVPLTVTREALMTKHHPCGRCPPETQCRFNAPTQGWFCISERWEELPPSP